MKLNLSENAWNKLNRMWSASWESIGWRQDQYPTGGIIESDERVDEGRKLYWPWCWPRNMLVESMLSEKYFDRVRLFLEFWEKCQPADGGWLHCYDIRTCQSYPGAKQETDNVGYMLWHIHAYVEATGDIDWLKKHRKMVFSGADYILSKFNPELNLVWGVEEMTVIDERTGKEIDCPAGYTTGINAVCEKGLRCAADLSAKIGDAQKAKEYAGYASKIARAIDEKLFDESAKTYVLGILDDGTRFLHSFWFILMPGYVNNRWDDHVAATFDYVWSHNHGHDPKIPESVWGCDLRPVMNKTQSCFFEYSGLGPGIGISPAFAHLLLLSGDVSRASQLIELITQYTNDSNQIPEHINTIHKGKCGNYGLYPDGYYWVDSGNLMHLSFFLRLLTTFRDLFVSRIPVR